MGAVFLLLLVWMVVELIIWYVIAQFISGFWVFLWFIAAFLLGINLLKRGMKNVSPMAQQMQSGGYVNPATRPPESVMTKSIALVVSGLLLALPGVLSDVLATLLLLPPVQTKAKQLIDRYMQKNQQKMMDMMAERMKTMNIDPNQFGGQFGAGFGGSGFGTKDTKTEGFKGKSQSGFGGFANFTHIDVFGTNKTIDGEAKVVDTTKPNKSPKDTKRISHSANDEE